MFTITTKKIDEIPDNQIKSVMVQLGILKDENKNPTENFQDAWELIESYSRKQGWGFSLDVAVTDAMNGYRIWQHWIFHFVKYREFCTICETNKLFGDGKNLELHDRHKWESEWQPKYLASEMTPQLAICKSLIQKALDEESKDDKS